MVGDGTSVCLMGDFFAGLILYILPKIQRLNESYKPA
jgi:hypothetical protein